MKSETLTITTYQYAELNPGAQQVADRNIASIIQYLWSNEPAVQQLVGLRPNSTEAEAKAAEPNVRGWIASQVAHQRNTMTFLESGEAFELDAFKKAISRPPPEAKAAPHVLTVPANRLVDPQGRLIQ